MRSFVSGVIWGGVVAVLGLGAASVMAPPPAMRAANSNGQLASNEPAKTQEMTPAEGAGENMSQSVIPDTTAPQAAPETVAPSPDTEAKTEAAPETSTLAPKLPDAPTDEAAAPVVPGADAAPDAGKVPMAAGGGGNVDPEPSAPPTFASDAPQPEPQAQTFAPDAPLVPVIPGAAASLTSQPDAQIKTTQPNRPAIEAGDAQPAAAELPPVPPLTPEEQALVDATLGMAPGLDAELPADLGPSAPSPDSSDQASVDLAPEPEPLLDAPERPTPGFAPVAPRLNSVDGVTTGRLPSISQDTTENPIEAAAQEAAVGPLVDQPPLLRYAAEFENRQSKPLFAVILIDTGAADINRGQLASLPFAVTFALDPTQPNVAEIAKIYRDGGKEVVMLAQGIPAGASAADLEVSFQVLGAALPEAVAVMDLETDGFQNDRPLASQVVPVIKGQGRGLLTWDRGLNAGAQVAQREDLAAASIFKRLDAEDESAPVIRRYLDRAAFKAAQEGRVTVAGETRPETIEALLEWSVEGRASSVALAPVSAVLAQE